MKKDNKNKKIKLNPKKWGIDFNKNEYYEIVESNSARPKDSFKGKNAFTLAEILITLSVIGVVAAISITSFATKTRQQEYTAGGKKAYAVINSAVQNVILQDSMYPEDFKNKTPEESKIYINALKKKLNIVRDVKDSDGNNVIYTTDGIRYHIINPYTYYADVNEDNGPTKSSTQKSDWKSAKYSNTQELFGLSWKNVELSDMFYIYFNPDNGRSVILPYVQGVENIAAGANP